MFKVYKASAGSGKTTSLVAEYLSICLLRPEKFKNILAITFTNNATAEMKERIIKTLTTFAFEPRSSFSTSDQAIFGKLKTFNSSFESLSESDFQKKAQNLLQMILDDYPSFTISTIDSFFQRILRSFALELGLNMNYNVEIELNECYNQTIDMVLNRLSKDDPDLSKRILFLVDRQMNTSGRWHLEKELKQTLQSIYDEKSFEPIKGLSEMYNHQNNDSGNNALTDAVRDIYERQKQAKDKLKVEIDHIIQLIDSIGSDASLFISGTTGIFSWAHKLSKEPLREISKNVQKALSSDSVLKKATPASLSLHPDIVATCDRISILQAENKKIGIIASHASSLLLLFDLKATMDEIKIHDNLFYLSETNGRIYEEIKDDEAPFIYEKIGNRFSHFFIDEFQDTSKLQWENIKPLIFNSLSSEDFNHESGSAILFGDVKQSIYRFRNGDSRLLNELSTVEGYISNFDRKVDADSFKIEALDTNYRSSRQVIDFNNKFFKYLSETVFESEKLKTYYADVTQKNPSSKEGFVHIHFKGEEESGDYLCEQSINCVREALSQGYEYKDIAILTKANITGSVIANYLTDNNIPVVSSDSLLLYTSEQVALIVNTLRYILNSQDKLAQLAIAEYFCHDNLSQAADIIGTHNSFHEFLQILNNDILPKGKEIDIERLTNVQLLMSMPVFTLVKEIIRIYRLTENNAYVIALLDAVYANFNSQFSDLTQFMTWWEELGVRLSISSSKDTNAVIVTTIHKSKGLQYPIVIYPMTRYRYGNGSETAWVKTKEGEEMTNLPYLLVNTSQSALSGTEYAQTADDESEMTIIDNVNVLYVAHTRAVDGLHIITDQNDKGNYSKFLNNYLQQEGIKPESDSSLDYWLGDRDFSKQKKNIPEEASQTIEQIYVSDFTLQSEEITYNQLVTTQQEMGIFIHDFLARLTAFPQTDAEIEMTTSTLDPEEKRVISAIIKKINEDPSLKPYFAPGVKVLNENTILRADGQLRRPDRIVFLDDEVMVIDYKTGKENEAYQRQLDEYCNLLESMGYSNVKSRIIYL